MGDVWAASFGIKSDSENEETKKEEREEELVKWVFNV